MNIIFKFISNYNRISNYKKYSTKLFNNYFSNHEVKKLQIGCGENNILDGWLNTDIGYKKNKIRYLDAGERFPFKDNIFSYIYSEHIFEHLNFKQAKNMLIECYRVLKPDGVLRIATPNLDFLIKIYENPELPIHKEYILWATKTFIKDVAKSFDKKDYLNVFVINNFFRDWGHQIIHNYGSVSEMLISAGFNNIVKGEIYKSSVKELNNLEKHGDGISNKFNELETMIIEATK